MVTPKKWILPIIVFAQFCCTSLWFAGNGVMNDLVSNFQLESSALGHLTSAVQFGFISGTLVFALLSLADRFSPSKVFLISAILGSVFNLTTIWPANELNSLLVFRFLTGFFLAGIYPVGMKIATDYFDKNLGKSLGFLVGALVLGTAFPHLLKGFTNYFPWEGVLVFTSSLALIGGLLIFVFVPNGPFRKKSMKLDLSACFKIFKDKDFTKAAIGYFGHMWELYAFWAFVPIMLSTYQTIHPQVALSAPNWSFGIIAIGGLACVLGAYLAPRFGTSKIAVSSLLFSTICCLVSPILFLYAPLNLFLIFLLLWGMVVIADSPMFSTLVAQKAPPSLKGTALTIVNCIGFSITIISIQLISLAGDVGLQHYSYMGLAFGPLLALFVLMPSFFNSKASKKI